MENFHELISKRRSIRKYTEEPLKPEQVELLLSAGLKSPTSKNAKSWQFVVVENKEELEFLSKVKKSALPIISKCAIAIVILGDPIKSEVWIEDASFAGALIQLQAEDLDLGSCWIQIRGRQNDFGMDCEEYIKDHLNIPLHLRVLAIIAVGNKGEKKPAKDDSNLAWEKVHIGKYRIEE